MLRAKELVILTTPQRKLFDTICRSYTCVPNGRQSKMRHLAFFWETVQILCASCCCTQSDPSLVRVGRPWLSTATQCYLPIILGMDTDNLCELYRRSTRSTEFDGAHKDIRGPDLPASPWRAIQIWSHYYAQFRTIQSAAAQTTTVLAKEIWPVQQSHSVCHCKAFALDILCLLQMVSWTCWLGRKRIPEKRNIRLLWEN